MAFVCVLVSSALSLPRSRPKCVLLFFLLSYCRSVITNICFLFDDRIERSWVIWHSGDLTCKFSLWWANLSQKIGPSLQTKTTDESGQSTSTRSAKKEVELQRRKKKRVYERLVKHGYFPAESVQTMDENERFHGLSAWRIQLEMQIDEAEEAKCPSWGVY